MSISFCRRSLISEPVNRSTSQAASPSSNMSIKIMSIALLLLSVSLCTQGRLPTDIVSPCCTKVSSANISAIVTKGPEVQHAHGKCVEALIFRTSKGTACVNPAARWTKKFVGSS